MIRASRWSRDDVRMPKTMNDAPGVAVVKDAFDSVLWPPLSIQAEAAFDGHGEGAVIAGGVLSVG
jgi:hypothetical protein